MEVMFERVAGIDIGNATLTVCVRTPGDRSRRRQPDADVQDDDVDAAGDADWLLECGVTLAALESTSTYWKARFCCRGDYQGSVDPADFRSFIRFSLVWLPPRSSMTSDDGTEWMGVDLALIDSAGRTDGWRGPMTEPIALADVFGIRRDVNPRSYVNRGGLDERLRYLLGTDRLVVIHGDSKQGKSWLRSRILNTQECIVVQCQLGTTPEQMLRQALGVLNIRCEIKRKSVGTYEGSIEFAGSGEIGMSILGKLGLSAKASGKSGGQEEVESEPIGQAPADLNWVSRVLAASGKRLVIEDFHYVSEEARRECAYVFKALGDLGVFPIVIGIWPTDHLLSYYNGDLEGRVEDIHLTWSQQELEAVLAVGSQQLRIAMSGSLRHALVSDAYGNVGLLQRLAEELCRWEQVFFERIDSPFLTPGPSLARAQKGVADTMRNRYEVFAENFVRGMRRLPSGLEVYKHILRVASDAADSDLEHGLATDDLLSRINSDSGTQIRMADLTQALQRLDRLQSKINVRPVVLAYNRSTRKLHVVDKSFLFFRKYGEPSWPWLDGSFDPSNDLAAGDPLDVDR